MFKCEEDAKKSIEKKMQEREKQEAEDRELLRELKADPAILAELQYRILSRKLHNQIYGMVTEAIENDVVQVKTVEDLLTLIELDLLLN
ncbi:MAG: hypothetical protein ACI4AQ_05785 [Lachnospiraceae bacterium]